MSLLPQNLGVRGYLPSCGKYPPTAKKTNSPADRYLLLIGALRYPPEIKAAVLNAYFLNENQLRKELDDADYLLFHRPYEINCSLWSMEYKKRAPQCAEFGILGVLDFAMDWYYYFERDLKHLNLLDELIAIYEKEKTKRSIV